MALNVIDIQDQLVGKFGEDLSNFRMEHDILTLEATPQSAKEVIRYVKEDAVLRFNYLTDLCGVHYPDNSQEAQFAVVYLLHNWMDNIRVRVKAYLSASNVQIETLTDIFAAANWMERETYDFFGIVFKGHPNLTRILNDKGMTVFPMRKEYALEDAGRYDKDDRFFGRTTNNYEPKEQK